VHAVVSRDHVKADELVGAVNRGLKKLKDSGAHAAIVQKHLASLWDGSAFRSPPPAFASTAAAKPGAEKKLQEPASATPDPLPKVPPALSAAERARALRFVKKGDEELGDGRVASARLLYERAAEMGIAQAAMAMAGTYDADELARLNLTNVQPDAAQAKRWYERALRLGAKDAGQRIRRLVGANTKQ
jgi:TPR repeat protein